MVFKRKETDNPIQTKAYKFRIFPEYQKPDFPAEIKEEIFREARLMNDLWNKLVEIRKDILEAYDSIFREEAAKVSDADAKMSAKKLRSLSPEFNEKAAELWQSYENRIKEVAADQGIRENVSWEAREDIFNRFETSHKKAIKEGGEIKFQPGFIQQFHFPHRFTGGGLDANAIFSARSKKISIQAVEEEYYATEHYRDRLSRVSSGRFGAGIGNRLQIPFRIVLHRQIPKDAKIKTAVLTGKIKNGVWSYFLVLTVDEPLATAETETVNKSLVAGLDLGWRKFDDYIRVGVLADSAGNHFEFRLPVNPPKKQSLRRLEKMLAKHGKAVPEYPQSWQDIEDFQTKNDLLIERVKEKLRELDLPPTETVKPILDYLVKVRKSGLLRLLRALEAMEETFASEDDGSTAINILRTWREEYQAREKSINYARERLINDRNHKYQLIAKWLKDNYSILVYEGDLNLKEMAVKAANVSLLEENGAMLRNSAKFRGRVALYELTRWIKQKNRRGEQWLHAKKSAYTTMICRICGSSCDKTAALIIVCPQGHKVDQDVQAATNLRNEVNGNVMTTAGNITIPEQLKQIIVPLLLD